MELQANYKNIERGYTNQVGSFSLATHKRHRKLIQKINHLLEVNEIDIVFSFAVHKNKGFPIATTLKMAVDGAFEFNSREFIALLIIGELGISFAPITSASIFDIDLLQKNNHDIDLGWKVDKDKLIKNFIEVDCNSKISLPDFGMKKTNDQIYKEYLMSKITSGMPDPVQKMKSKKI